MTIYTFNMYMKYHVSLNDFLANHFLLKMDSNMGAQIC